MIAPRIFSLPTSNEIRSKAEGVIGPLYEPKTEAGRVIETIGEFAPAAIGGGEALVPKLLTKVLVPALATEGAGYYARGSKYEPAARIVGAALGGWSAANWERELRSAWRPNAVTAIQNGQWTNNPVVRAFRSGWLEHRNQSQLHGPTQRSSDDTTSDAAK
jgi:hypothetical protein